MGRLTDNIPCAGADAVRPAEVAPTPLTVLTGPSPVGEPVPLYPSVIGTPPMFWPFSVAVTTVCGTDILVHECRFLPCRQTATLLGARGPVGLHLRINARKPRFPPEGGDLGLWSRDLRQMLAFSVA